MRMSKRATTLLAVGLVGALAMAGCSKKGGGSGSSSESGGGQKQISVAFVPKLQGIPYFEAMNTGGQKAAKDLGINWIYKGSTTADPGAQTDIVKSLIQQKVDVLVVAPNDPDSMAPVLADAKAKGIHVMTSDTDAPNSVREVFVNQANTEGIGQALTDSLLEKMGGQGKYAIVSCGQTAANLNAWIDVQKKYTAEKYPKAQIVDTVYAGEDEAKAVSMAKDLMNAHPDLTGLVGECTSSAPGVAKAVREAGKVGKVFTVGLGTPQAMKPYLADGSSSAAILWNVENLGYLTAWAGKQLAEGKTFASDNQVSSDLSGVKYSSDKKELLLGDPLRITKDNVDQFNY
ncbi:autoinducer 2 ABC transporter substrate-binding protein [Micromonospora sp. NPDC023966]|uniref:autoinducer 2 ABC transporter substrate-binding protein n=1 Tax=Micromonospora sp. NPDC023966 TaxID=3154699 RepID=UPI0033F93ADD